MRKKLLTVLVVFLLTAGLELCLFPMMSNIIGEKLAEADILKFEEQVNSKNTETTYLDALQDGEIDDKGYPIDESGERIGDTPLIFKADLDRLYADSVEYNETLKTEQMNLLINSSSYISPDIDLASYGIYSGIYGYISAPSIDMKLPKISSLIIT